MSKFSQILLAIILLLGGVVFIQYKHSARLSDERDRYKQNNTALLSDIERIKVDSTTMAVDAKALRLTIDEYERFRAADAEKIRHMREVFKQMHREGKRWVGVDTNDETYILLENLAKNEHLRWNASHILLGYLPDKGGNGCKEVMKLHSCLVSWDELEEYEVDYKYYDYMFVEMALKIKEEQIKRG